MDALAHETDGIGSTTLEAIDPVPQGSRVMQSETFDNFESFCPEILRHPSL